MKRKKAKMSVHSGIREINEIVRHAHDEIRASSDEICDCAADEIKSTHPPSRRISSPPGDFIIEDDFSHPTGVDLVEKKEPLSKDKGSFFSGGATRIRTGESGFCRPVPYHLAMAPNCFI